MNTILRLAAAANLAWLGGAMVGCGAPGGEATEPPGARATATAAAVTAVTTSEPSASAAASGSAQAEPGWDWKGPSPGFGQSFYKDPIVVDTKIGPRCRFVYDDKAKTRSVECLRGKTKDRAWGWDEGAAFVEDAALAADEEQLYVALFSNISSGCEVRALRLDSGQEAWRTEVLGLGPIHHSEYLNEVQIGLLPQTLEVLGWESAGRYLEVLDPASGRRRSTLRTDTSGKTTRIDGVKPKIADEPSHPGIAGSVRWAWTGKGQQRDPANVSVSTPDQGRCAFEIDSKAETTHLYCEDRAKKRLWGIDRARQSDGAGTLLVDDKRMYFADHSAISAGTTVWAFERSSGRLAWKTRLFGDGPVSHSKYRNDVQMAFVDGRLAIFGWESAGKYVEVLDPTTGSDLGNRRE